MSGVRGAFAVPLVLAFATVLAAAVLRLPSYGASRGPYEMRRAVEAVRTRHVDNLDAFVNFDLRGFDTLGEEFIFFVAVGGFALLLRERRGPVADRPRPPVPGRADDDAPPSIRLATRVYVPAALIFGFYVVIHGQLTPGGGFQGGVVLATAALGIFLGGGITAFERVFPKAAVEVFETLGAAGYLVIGAAGVATGGIFMANVLPLGVPGALLSSGTILALNDVVGIAVAGGFIVLFSEFMNEMRAPRDEPAE